MDLETRMAVSRRRSNLLAASTTAALMASFLFFDYGTPGRAELVRQTAAFMSIMHSLLYFVSMVLLRGMVRRRVANAELALAYYRDPRRISHRDLAVAWVCLLVAARYVL